MAEAFKLYKLIILYMLDKVDFPLTNSQISEFILNEGYTTYCNRLFQSFWILDLFVKSPRTQEHFIT